MKSALPGPFSPPADGVSLTGKMWREFVKEIEVLNSPKSASVVLQAVWKNVLPQIMTWKSVPDRYFLKQKVSDVLSHWRCVPLDDASLGRCDHWTMRPMDDATLWRCGPWTMRPLDDPSLGWCVAWMMRSLDDATLERSGPWTKRPWDEASLGQSITWTMRPRLFVRRHTSRERHNIAPKLLGQKRRQLIKGFAYQAAGVILRLHKSHTELSEKNNHVKHLLWQSTQKRIVLITYPDFPESGCGSVEVHQKSHLVAQWTRIFVYKAYYFEYGKLALWNSHSQTMQLQGIV
jgi:hypothetical protein